MHWKGLKRQKCKDISYRMRAKLQLIVIKLQSTVQSLKTWCTNAKFFFGLPSVYTTETKFASSTELDTTIIFGTKSISKAYQNYYTKLYYCI